MRRLVLPWALTSLLLLCWPIQIHAQVPDVHGVCVYNCTSPTPPTDPKESERKQKQRDLKAKGMEAYEEEKWTDAVTLFRDALTYGPDADISNYLKKAEALLKQQEADDAKKKEITIQLRKIAIDLPIRFTPIVRKIKFCRLPILFRWHRFIQM